MDTASLAFTALFCALLVLGLLTRTVLASRQIRHVARHRDQVPAPFDATIPLDAHRKAADYTIAKTRLGLLDTAFEAAVLVGWTLSCMAGVTLQAWIPTDILRWVAGLAILAVSAALSLVITARIVRPLRGLFVHHTAQSNASLVGQTCKVLTGVVDERQGRAEVAQRGASINVRVWSPSPNTLKRGDTALITEYDAGTHRYLVMPMPPA